MIGSTLKELLAQRDMNVSELSRRSGVPVQTLYSIIKRNSARIDPELLEKLCLVLEVPQELFKPDASAQAPFTPREWALIEGFRALDERGKLTLEALLRSELLNFASGGGD